MHDTGCALKEIRMSRKKRSRILVSLTKEHASMNAFICILFFNYAAKLI